MPSFPDVVIERHGVRLRALSEDDVPLIAVACSDPVTQHWLPVPRPYTEESARVFVHQIARDELASGNAIERAIEVEGQFVGVIGLKRTDWPAAQTEAGYWLGPWARGRGVMTRALCAITDWALDDCGIERVEVRAAPGNTASLATARKAGFVEEGTLRSAGLVYDGRVDLVVFSRLRSDPRPGFD